jgi:hypothetical protein
VNKSRQQLLSLGSVVLGLALIGLFGWLAYGNATRLLATQKLPPSLLDKGLFFIDGLKIYHWVLLFGGLFLAALPLMRKKSGETGETSAKAASKKASRRFASCAVLQAEKDVRQIWQFSTSGDKVTLQREESTLPNERLPASIVGKDWQSLFQPKLNVAWLPADQVFLRALQLPKTGDLAELQSMVELQLEKLSPMPVGQIVWTFEPMPTGGFGDLQTVIIIIVARSLVEEFLGKLEAQGYLADRLDLPLLDQIRATRIDTDGIWVYPDAGTDPVSCLVAWWYGHTLQNLSLVRLPAAENRGQVFQEQLHQMAWAGELEGWLTAPPRIHLVAEGETAAAWLPLFDADSIVQAISPLASSELAAMAARRATRASEGKVGLMLPELLARYRQQFIDRLWMRGVGALVLAYIFGVIIYFGVSEWANWRLDNVRTEISRSANSYTNALQLKEQVRVLQDQLDLQYAALDCYNAIAEFLPQGLMLDSMNFERGRRITIFGTAPADESPKVQEFNDALRKATAKGQPLFARVQAPSSNVRGNQLAWNFWCEIKRTEAE